MTLGPDGPIAMWGTAQDITERKQAEEELRRLELRYRTLVEQLPLGMYIRPIDMSQPNLYASPQLEPMIGYPAEHWEANAELLSTIVHPDDRDRVLSDAAAIRETGKSYRDEYRCITPTDASSGCRTRRSACSTTSGEPYVLGFWLDITDRKNAEAERDRLREALHDAQKLEAIGRLAGGVAHDFNNMLTAIKGYSELLLAGLEPGTRPHHEAEQIRRAAEQASSLPEQLLAFARKQPLEGEGRRSQRSRHGGDDAAPTSDRRPDRAGRRSPHPTLRSRESIPSESSRRSSTWPSMPATRCRPVAR